METVNWNASLGGWVIEKTTNGVFVQRVYCGFTIKQARELFSADKNPVVVPAAIDGKPRRDFSGYFVKSA
jgi:hypothetical protein